MSDVVAVVGRTSDRAEGRGAGAEALARALDPDARIVGAPGRPRAARYDEDLRDAAPVLAAAADVMRSGVRPVLTATDCSICVATLPAVAARHPEVRVLWLDAHGDFNTPQTSPSGFLGGMCLAGGLGLWDTGHGAGPAPDRVVLAGGRDLDDAEQRLLAEHGVQHGGDVVGALAGHEVFVHLDVDVLDPEVLPGQLYPAPGGLSFAALHDLLEEVAAEATVVAAEITCLSTPEHAPRVAQAAAPLLERTP